MLTLWILLWLAGCSEFVWFFMLRKRYQERLNFFRLMNMSSESVKAHADQLLRDAKRIYQTAQLSQENKVCDECHRIVVQHTKHRDGRTVCVNCAADLARKETVNG